MSVSFKPGLGSMFFFEPERGTAAVAVNATCVAVLPIDVGVVVGVPFVLVLARKDFKERSIVDVGVKTFVGVAVGGGGGGTGVSTIWGS